ncbi:50S ribosomal protein L15 [Candidatus Amesbacteria bacterium]|nr:50S ribosomal protein L15 [Candidatus Amesbacteria bacterium]
MKLTAKKMKIVGRGRGSGKGGHTTGRGHKGQLARERVHILFQGTKTKKSLIKRLPFMRGGSKNKSAQNKPTVLQLETLVKWPKSIPVTLKNLIERKLLKPNTKSVKILGIAKLEHELDVKVAVSASAKTAIAKAGGKTEEI